MVSTFVNRLGFVKCFGIFFWGGYCHLWWLTLLRANHMDDDYAFMITLRDFLVRQKSQHCCLCQSTFHKSDDVLCSSFADITLKSYGLESSNFTYYFSANQTFHLFTAKVDKDYFRWQSSLLDKSCRNLRYYFIQLFLGTLLLWPNWYKEYATDPQPCVCKIQFSLHHCSHW